MRKVGVRLALSLCIAVVLVHWLTDQGLHVLPSWRAIREAAVWWAVPAYVLLFFAFHVLRAWRWTYLLRPFANVPAQVMCSVAFIGFVAIQIMPLRTGEVARPYLLDRYTGASKSALFGTIAIERIVDGLLVSLSLTAALMALPSDQTPYVWGLKTIPLIVFSGALLLLIAFYRSPARISALLNRVVGFFSQRLARFSVGVLERFHAGLAALPKRRNFIAYVAISSLYWAINAVSFWVLAIGCGLSLSFAGAMAGMGCLAVGILLPAGPGYFGNFQVAVLAALDMYTPQTTSTHGIAVFIFLLYLLQTGLAILFGAAGAWGLRKQTVVAKGQPSGQTS
ncbi:MAG: lysylphosphatidylglycerol synthase transmembrane domain-containing protein [Myxococcota bacterium]|nr:lysylphosphatidylglycerol synthase transmembrane domain-containing protein [Myxococcota bacterium]